MFESASHISTSLHFCSFRFLLFQALVINEYTGLTFNCYGGGGGGCKTTGEQVIASLGFDNHPISYAIFGNGMLFIGFLGFALFLLVLNKMTFVPLGYQGGKYTKAVQRMGGEEEPLVGKLGISALPGIPGNPPPDPAGGQIELGQGMTGNRAY